MKCKNALICILLIFVLLVHGRSHLDAVILPKKAAAAATKEIGFSSTHQTGRDGANFERVAQGPIDPNTQGGARESPIDLNKQNGAREKLDLKLIEPAPSPNPPSALSTYRVVGVATNDVLNIRSGPNANLFIVSTIPSNGKGVRLVGGCTGQWCPIEYGGVRGWVNSRFLARE